MYHACGNRVDILLDFVDTYEDDGRDYESLIVRGTAPISPVADAQILLYGPDGEVTVHQAIYGCLPNQTIVIGVKDEPFRLDWYDDQFNARIILDPFTDDDDHIVEDVALKLN